MTDLLKGNFVPKNRPQPHPRGEETLEDRFEREALKQLGGSLAFVSKKKIKWDQEDSSS